MENIIGIIPARAGSKRVPNKNIRILEGTPLLTYTAKTALQTEKLNRVIISTDSEEIAEIAKGAGVEVPFIRPAHLAQDDTPDRPVLLHAIEWLERHEGKQPEMVVLLRPTAPLRRPQTIDEVTGKLIDSDADSVRTVTKVEGVHHPYWMYRKTQDGLAESILPGLDLQKYNRSQLLPPVFRLNGVVDAIRTEVIQKYENLYGDKMLIHEIAHQESFDIDTEFDFLMCEWLLQRREGN